jgi:arylsulfatase A-like enzyme
MGNHTDCKPDIKSLPFFLQKLGYRVVAANKTDVRPASVFPWEVLKATLPANPEHKRKYRAEGLDTKAVDEFLEAHARTQPDTPLCLLLGDNSPHVTWEPNKEFDPAALPIPTIMVDTPKTRTALANYFQDIATMDRRVGEVLASLAKHGLAEHTLFIYTADQGPEWPHCKWTCYDTGLRVPFIARWPGKIVPGRVSDALISFVDLTPTFVDVAGGQALPSLDGRSFKEVLVGKATKHQKEIFASHTGDGQMNQSPQRCVRDARYKFILNLNPERKWTTHFTLVDGIPNSHRDVYAAWLEKAKTDASAAKLIDIIEQHPVEELYDTQTDPFELHNLAAEPAMQRVLKAMREKLHVWRDSVGDY